jgi:hypothetical protein
LPGLMDQYNSLTMATSAQSGTPGRLETMAKVFERFEIVFELRSAPHSVG